MTIEIRNYRPSDLDACRRLWAELTQAHREIYHDPTIGGADPGKWFDDHLEKLGSDRIWLADDQGVMCGMTGLELTDEQGVVEPLVVSPEYRFRGLGRLLVERVMEEASRLGLRYLSVRPVARNQAAISFFYHAGFNLLGQIELFMELGQVGRTEWKKSIAVHHHRFGY
jgi:N-acetylglutamate synthase-like GNAT family acetyltransferase